MSDYMEKAPDILEDAYLAIISNPASDLDPEKKQIQADTIHSISLKIMQLNTADISALNAAFVVEGVKMEQALKTLEEIIKANPAHMKLLQGMDQALQMMNSFMMLIN